MADDVPAGWFPTPDGGQRYWDGQKWTSLPWDGDPGTKDPPKNHRRLIRGILIGATALVLVAGVGGGVALKLDADAKAEAAAAAQVQADKEEAAAEAQEKADDAERAARKAAIANVEASVEEMANGHVSDGVIDGPIIDVSCSPVGGGSTDDLTEQTTVFECFVANVDNGDGTMQGYYYNATMNWDSGEYTYGLGRP